jgi:LysM repeat protein
MTLCSPLLLVLLSVLMCLVMGGCQNNRPNASLHAAPAQQVQVHMVVAGETLSSIASDFGVTVKAIVDANDLRSAALHEGQRLQIPGGRPPEAAIAGVPLEPVSPSDDWYIPRKEWAVDPIIISRTKPMAGTPMRITVHHSGDVKDASMDPIEWLRLIDRQHMEGLGKKEPWACIGYHFIIAPDGRVFEGRPLLYQGAHAGWDEVNRLNIGVCLIGDFDRVHVPAAQRDSLLRVLDRLCRDYGISHANVFGHQHWKTTDCPGRYLMAIIDGYAEQRSDAQPATHLATFVQPDR